MAFEQFLSTIRSDGVAKASHFFCEIQPPQFMTGNKQIIEKIPFYINSVNFPEFTLATATIMDNGLKREAVYDKLYGDIVMSFTCDQGMLIKKFFDDWTQFPVLSKGGRFSYSNRYIAETMILCQVDALKNVVYFVVLNNIYPKLVDDINMNSSSRSLATFNVKFTYESWESYQYPMDEELEITINNYKSKNTVPKNRVWEFLHRYLNIPTLEGLQNQITGMATNRLKGLLGEKTYSIDSRINQRINGILGQTKSKLLNL